MKKKLMLYIVLFFVVFMNVNFTFSAYWVNNPANCPILDGATFPGFSCAPTNICGQSGGTARCSDTSLFNAPTSSTTTNSAKLTTSLTGGYIVDCYANTDSASPYCDNNGNFWCNADSSCYNVNRKTTCNQNKFSYQTDAFTCGTCRDGYTYCDGSYTDGDGCEIRIGVTNFPTGTNNNYAATCQAQCDAGFEDCDSTGAGVGNGCEWQVGSTFELYGVMWTRYASCVASPDKSYFETGTNAIYYTSDPLLWGTQVGEGVLVNVSNGTNAFLIDNSGCLVFYDGTVQCSAGAEANNPLANYLAEAAGWSTDESSKTITEYKVGINNENPTYNLDVTGTARVVGELIVEGTTFLNNLNVSGFTVVKEFNATNFVFDGSGQIANNLVVDINTLFVDSVNNRVGIGTLNPSSTLEVLGVATIKNSEFGEGNGALILGGGNPTLIQRVQRSGGGYAYDLFTGYADNTATGRTTKILSYGAYGGMGDASNDPSLNYAFFGVGNTSSYSNTHMRLYDNANKVVYFDGNVGIGVISPGQKLDILGNIRSSGQLISTIATGTSPLIVSSTTKVANLNADLLDNYNTATSATTGNVIYVSKSDGILPTNTIDSTSIVDRSIQSGDVAISAIGNNELFKGGDWLITSALNIGTNGQALSISTDGYLSDEDDPVTINDDLRVTGDAVILGTAHIGSLNVSGFSVLQTLNATDFVFDGNGQISDNLVVDTNTLFVDSLNNRVGIGNINPQEKLDVTGNIRSSGQLISTITTGTSPLVVSSTTKVTNLNSDLLDNYNTATSLTAGNVIYVSKSNGILPDNTIDSTSIVNRSILSEDIAISAVGNNELFKGGDWLITSALNIGTNGQALSISTDGYLSDEDDPVTINDQLKVIGTAVFDSSITANSFVGNGALITNINANNIATGTLGTDRYDAYNDLSVSGRLNYDAVTDLVLKSQLLTEVNYLNDSINQVSGDYLKRDRNEEITGSYTFSGGNVFFDTDVFFKDNVTFVNAQSTRANTTFEVTDLSGATQSVLGVVGSSGRLTLKNSGTDRIILDANGNSYITNNLGIGNTNPGQKLDVTGSIRASSQLISTIATGTAPLVVSSTTKVTNLNSDLLDGYDSSYFMVGTTDNWVNTVGDTMSGHLTMSGTNANVILGSNYLSGDGGDEGITVTSTGNVGVGKTGATEKLDVLGNIKASGTISGSIDSSNITSGVLHLDRIPTIPNSKLQNSALTVTAGTGLNGGGSISLGSSATINLANTAVTAGTYGSSAGIQYSKLTVDAQGRLTAASTETIRSATTSQTGIVQLSSSTSSTSDTLAATASAVKSAYDLAATKVSKSGDTMSGQLTMSGTSANIALGSNYLSGDGGDEGISIGSTGNVGIGEVAGTYKLKVEGAVNLDDKLKVESNEVTILI